MVLRKMKRLTSSDPIIIEDRKFFVEKTTFIPEMDAYRLELRRMGENYIGLAIILCEDDLVQVY